jgi:multidrug efflux pump subunit AcrB
MILLTLGGIASALSLPVSLFPQIDYPRVVVSMMPASAMPHKWKRR